MQALELSLRFIRPMHKIGVEYMVTGSIAAIIYSEPRLTNDIDIIIDLKPDQIQPFHDIYDEKEFYVPPVEALKVEAGRSVRGHFNLLHKPSGFKADMYFKGKEKLHEWAFDLRTKKKVDSERMYVASAEYVIIRKLIYYKEGRSEKHLEDIRNIIQGSDKQIKFDEIEEKNDEYNLDKIWKMI